MSAERAMVCCPYHDDKNPSASINLNDKAPVPMGWFRCFGGSCHKSVPWNTVAATLGLAQIGKNKRKRSEDYLNPEKFKDELLDEAKKSERGFEREMSEMEFFDFQDSEWRGVPRKLLERVGARLAYLDRTGDFYAWLPVMIEGELKGYVKGTLEKAEEGKSSYFNASGTWSGQFGLLFYDFAIKMMRRKHLDTVVLVEGPRDALRLLRYGIPAMAVLGAINWNDEKRYTLERSGVGNVILFMDGDDAGIEATTKIYESCRTHFKVRRMALWKYRVPKLRANGRQAKKKLGDGKYKLLWDNEMDPGNCPIKYLKKVKNALV
jgi:5S rRNA maturation endonuclease (ribonuclease M5)